MIIAEEITARFFNVISLFNGFIPIMAIQLSAIEVEEAVTLVFTTVLDRTTLGLEEDDEKDEPADRNYWLSRGSPETLAVTDELHHIIQEVDPGVQLKYNKHYIGLAHSGIPSNFAVFRPRKSRVIVQFRIPRSEEITQRLEDAGMDILTYDAKYGNYQLRVDQEDIGTHKDLLRDLSELAKHNFGGSSQ